MFVPTEEPTATKILQYTFFDICSIMFVTFKYVAFMLHKI